MSNYHLEENGDKVVLSPLGPVIDLKGIDRGLEGTMEILYGSGDQTAAVKHQGTLRRDEEEGFAFDLDNGEVRHLDLGNVVYNLARGIIDVNIILEEKFLRAYFDCFNRFDDENTPLCSIFQIGEECPEQFYKGIIAND